MQKKKFRFLAGILTCMISLTAIPSQIKANDIPYNQLQINTQDLKTVYNTLFDKELTKQDASIVSKEESKSIPVALTELDNGKIAYTVDGEPFYPIAVETGWWDTRIDNNGYKGSQKDVGDDFKKITDEEWNRYFSDMSSMGFNTVQLMIHWRDWEPENNKFDFTFLNHVTDLADQNGLKTEFIVFFHSQTNYIPLSMDKFWGYDLDNQTINVKKYSLSMQWGEDLTSSQDFRDYLNRTGVHGGKENFLEYWHPVVFKEMEDALTKLAENFKDSDKVIGYQIGNEEGFNYYTNNGNDDNSYYKELEKIWLQENPNGNLNEFRADTINNLWKHFSNTIHKVDPYKPTTTNTQGGEMEKSGVQYGSRSNDGMTIGVYENVDMIGSMFYGGASSIYTNLDNHYVKKANNDIQKYAKSFPILFPTEISATMNDGSVAKQISAQTIARGGQGFGLYCYGELYNNFEPNETKYPQPVLGTIKTLVRTVKDVEDLVYAGVPVNKDNTNNVAMEIVSNTSNNQGNPTLSILEKDNENYLGVLHFWGNANSNKNDANANVNRTIEVGLTAKESGNYNIKLHKTNGNVEVRNVNITKANEKQTFILETTGLDVTYIEVRKVDIPVNPEDKVLSSIELISKPNQTTYMLGEEFNKAGLQVRAVYNDGSAEILDNNSLEVSGFDSQKIGQQTITVTYEGKVVTFDVTVKEPKYATTISSFYQDSLDKVFDGNKNENANFKATEEELNKMKEEKAYFQYNFDKNVELSGVDIYAVNGHGQGITKYKIATADKDGNWNFVKENGEDKVFVVDWKLQGPTNIEKQSNTFEPIKTDKVRVYVLDVNHIWTEESTGVNKFAIREIEFQTKDYIPTLQNIEVTTMPSKTEYMLGEELDLTGLIVNANYEDGTKVDVTKDVKVSGYDKNKVGEQTITVAFEEQTATFKVNVKEAVVLKGIEVVSPNKIEYTIGETMVLEGMSVKAIYSDGTKKDIALEEVTITGFDSTQAGEKVITVTYEDKVATFTVSVKEEVKPQPPIDTKPTQDTDNKAEDINKPQKTNTDNSSNNKVDRNTTNIAKTGDNLSLNLLVTILASIGTLSLTKHLIKEKNK